MAHPAASATYPILDIHWPYGDHHVIEFEWQAENGDPISKAGSQFAATCSKRIGHPETWDWVIDVTDAVAGKVRITAPLDADLPGRGVWTFREINGGQTTTWVGGDYIATATLAGTQTMVAGGSKFIDTNPTADQTYTFVRPDDPTSVVLRATVATGAAGPAGAGLQWRAAWSNAIAYNANDIVSHNGSTWLTPAGTTAGLEPSVATEWDLFAQGDGGADIDFYEHTQTIPATVWDITHPLGWRPAVDVVIAGEEIIADIDYVSATEIRVRHAVALAGTAYLR